MPNRRILLFAFLLAGLAATAVPIHAQFPSDSVIRAVIQDRVTAGRSSGIVVGLLEPDGRTRIIAFNERQHGEPVFDGRTVFEIGSITKAFTGALLADMVAQGDVKLDDLVATYLPGGVKVPTRSSVEITLIDLATHSSGLPRLPTNMHPASFANPYADYSVAQLYDLLSEFHLGRDIGAKYEYSNLGAGLLGHALALRARKSYEALVRERILAPLEMSSTTITLNDELKSRLAPGHNALGEVVPNWDLPTLAGAGALRSTVEDMLKFAAANLETTSTGLPARMRLAQRPQRAAGSDEMQIGLLWHIMKRPDRVLTWHNGGTGGYHSFIGFDLQNRRAVVLLSNMLTPIEDIAFHLLDPSMPIEPARRSER